MKNRYSLQDMLTEAAAWSFSPNQLDTNPDISKRMRGAARTLGGSPAQYQCVKMLKDAGFDAVSNTPSSRSADVTLTIPGVGNVEIEAKSGKATMDAPPIGGTAMARALAKLRGSAGFWGTSADLQKYILVIFNETDEDKKVFTALSKTDLNIVAGTRTDIARRTEDANDEDRPNAFNVLTDSILLDFDQNVGDASEDGIVAAIQNTALAGLGMQEQQARRQILAGLVTPTADEIYDLQKTYIGRKACFPMVYVAVKGCTYSILPKLIAGTISKSPSAGYDKHVIGTETYYVDWEKYKGYSARTDTEQKKEQRMKIRGLTACIVVHWVEENYQRFRNLANLDTSNDITTGVPPASNPNDKPSRDEAPLGADDIKDEPDINTNIPEYKKALKGIESDYESVGSAGTKSAKCVAIMLEIIKKHDPNAAKLTGYRLKINGEDTSCFVLRAEKNLPKLVNVILGKTKWSLSKSGTSVITSSWWKTNVLNTIEEIKEEVSDEISKMNKTKLKAAIRAYSNYADVWEANKETSYGNRYFDRALKGHLVHFLSLLSSDGDPDKADDPTQDDSGFTGEEPTWYANRSSAKASIKNMKNKSSKKKRDAYAAKQFLKRRLSPKGGSLPNEWDQEDLYKNEKAFGYVAEGKYSLRRMLLNESSMFDGGDSPITFALLAMGEEDWMQDAEVEQEIAADSDVLSALENTE